MEQIITIQGYQDIEKNGKFICFICEEAMQTAMFGSFAYFESGDVKGIREHIQLMEDVHKTSSVIINTIGILAPFSYPAYKVYLKSNAGYIKASKARYKAMKKGGEKWKN
jgi:hypothetical protein